jgi:hypothetical protein
MASAHPHPLGSSPIHWDDIHSDDSVDGDDADVTTPEVNYIVELRTYMTVMVCPGALGFTLADNFKMSDILKENNLENTWNILREFESPSEGFHSWVGYEIEGPMLMAPQLTQ